MARVMVDVTAEDIRECEPGSCERCAVARPISRALGGRWQVSVNHLRAHFYQPHSWNCMGSVEIPTEAAQFIADFDAGRPVQPLSFPLDIPDVLLTAPEPEEVP